MNEFLVSVLVIAAAAAIYWAVNKVRASRARKKAQQSGSGSGPNQSRR